MSGKEDGPGSTHRRLGRGIGALLNVPVRVAASQTSSEPLRNMPAMPFGDGDLSGNIPQRSPSAVIQAGSEEVLVPRGTSEESRLRTVRIEQIAPNPRQPRRDFDEASIRALSESIRTAGLMQPVVVRPSSSDSGRFELIAGERRWRAAKLLGLSEIPAILHEVSDQVAAEWALIENIQREDLNPIERSEALGRLIKEFSLTHQDLADRLGMDRVTITNLLRLDDLDPFTKDAVRRGELSQGHAKVLLGVLQLDLRKKLASAALSGSFSVRELERRVKELGLTHAAAGRVQNPQQERKPHLQDLERRLSEYLGTKVSMEEDRTKKGRGRVFIDYYSLEQFEGLMARIGFDLEP